MSKTVSSSPSKVVVFNEPAYPLACTEPILANLLPQPYQLANAANLAGALGDDCGLLVSFHGPYFPKAAWSAILAFLERGGNLALFGGMPFTRPVNQAGQVEPELQAYTDQLYLGPFFQLDLPENFELVANPTATILTGQPLTLPSGPAGTFWAFYPKLTQTSDHPAEMGSAGPLDTILTPLVFARAAETNLATPFSLLDQRSGRFMGGRWLISAWQPSNEAAWLGLAPALQELIKLTAEGCQTLEVRPALACYQPGETPSLIVSARTTLGFQIHLTVTSPAERLPRSFEVSFEPSPLLQEQRIELPPAQHSGLYQVETVYGTDNSEHLTQTSGFWVWDQALVEGTQGQKLRSGRDFFYQGDELFFVFGTTYMDSQVQRRFLTLPNPARWDKDFAEMKAAGVNLIRTGIWTAWRQFMPVTGVADETALRALDAFVMTACRYDMQVIFTFFTFTPPLFEGHNPWLDPQSLRGQEDFVTAFVRRYAQVELLSWDLINEPSFGDPAKIFNQRPISGYDRFELTAFRQWLQNRYSLDELHQRWHVTVSELPSWEAVSPPVAHDYTTHPRDNTARNMLKVADYTLFSQEIFGRWAERMYRTIRAAGSPTLVGVGQDESGSRISPQFYASSVDYTTTHPWWNNDALLWDMTLDKSPFKPNLIQETGVMLVRDVDGRPWRSEQKNADLLERKLWMGLAARGAGVIQWLWHTNAYMTSDNENSIGLVRADGSVKPEMTPFLEFGRAIHTLLPQLIEPANLPNVWLVVPYSQWFARPDWGIEATQRAVRTLGYEFGIIPQLVAEQELERLVETGQTPQTVIVPGVQLLAAQTWASLQKLAESGATILVSGVISRDAHNLPFVPEWASGLGLETQHLPGVSRYETLTDLNGEPCQLVFEAEKIAYVRKANNNCQHYPVGAGGFIWAGLPLELSNDTQSLRRMYAQALNQTNRSVSGPEAQVLVIRRPLKNNLMLVIIISEAGTTQTIEVEGQKVEVQPDRAGGLLLQDDQLIAVFGGLQAHTETARPYSVKELIER